MIHRQNDMECREKCGTTENQDCIHECMSPTCFAESKKQTEEHEQNLAFKQCVAKERTDAVKPKQRESRRKN